MVGILGMLRKGKVEALGYEVEWLREDLEDVRDRLDAVTKFIEEQFGYRLVSTTGYLFVPLEGDGAGDCQDTG